VPDAARPHLVLFCCGGSIGFSANQVVCACLALVVEEGLKLRYGEVFNIDMNGNNVVHHHPVYESVENTNAKNLYQN
jgi:hypothetical protein